MRYLLPSVTDLVFLALLASLSCGVSASRLLGDAGIGWHIRNGQQMLHTHTFTRVDVFSSTMSGHAWYAWEWLYDVMIAAFHHWAGLNGVVGFTAVVIALTFALTLRFALARGANLAIGVVLLALSMGASAIHLLARPHVLSWLFTVIWFQALDFWETAVGPAKDRRLSWLPVLMLFWVNLHGGFVTGFLLLGLYLAATCIRYAAVQERGKRHAAERRLQRLGSITLLSLLATFVNPYGYKLHLHIYEYLTNRFLMSHIDEFRSPDFHGVAPQCFAVLLVIAIGALAVARPRPRLSQLLVVLFAVSSGLYASRNLPVSSLLLMLVAAPILSRTIAGAGANTERASWLRRLVLRYESYTSRMASMEVSLRGHFWPALAVLLGLWVGLHGGRLGSSRLMDAHFDATRFPVQAVDAIAARGIRQPIFCPDYWGGYLIYRLYPQTKVVVDDRHDLYGEQFFKDYLKVVRVEPGWGQTLDQAHTDWVLAPVESPLASALTKTTDWVLAYRDNVAALFQRAGALPQAKDAQ